MGFDKLVLKLDETVTRVMGDWDGSSTCIFGLLITFVVYRIVTSRDPDSHPMLLARQAQASAVRLEGESAVYRSNSAPHGIPLNSGLNVKDPGDSKWARGRDGDLRDVWRRVVTGPTDQDGKPTNEIGHISTVLGTEKIIQHNLADVTRQINLIGQHIKQNGGSRVAIYLPNSIEFLAALFAGSFYRLTIILLPYDHPSDAIISMLEASKADTIVAAAGSFPFDMVAKKYPALKQVIWVVDEGSRHMDWNEVPTGTGGAVNVSTWQEIIQDQDLSVGTELPATERGEEMKNIIAFWPSKDKGAGELVEYTHSNLVSGISAQLSGVPTTQRFGPADLFLPADSLSTMYPLVLTLAALFANASLALNSVAGQSPDLTIATQGIAPTIIVTSASTLAKTHEEAAAKLTSPIYQVVHWFQTRTLVQKGVMPIASIFSRLYDSLRPVIGTTPGKLRLICVSDQAAVETTPLSSTTLSDLRIYTGARIIYALTTAKVAGAVSQTTLYDYRITSADKYSHFGAPVSSIEILFKDTKDYKTSDDIAAGEIVARGPAVVGGEANLGVVGKILADHTLAYV